MFYSIWAVTTAHHGCEKPKVFDFKNGLPRYRGASSGYLGPALCMSADSEYSGLALRLRMRSKSLTV